MKLYYAPEACSLSDHIALIEAGQTPDIERVDIRTKKTASGRDFRDISPKGYVPAFILDDGQLLTENVAVLDWIADRFPALRPRGSLARTRLLEMLAFISTEIHHAFRPLWHDGTDAEKAATRQTIAKLFQFVATQMRGDYIFGSELSVADCYLYVTLRWAERFGVEVPEILTRFKCRMEDRPAVQAALAQEEMPLHARPAAAAR